MLYNSGKETLNLYNIDYLCEFFLIMCSLKTQASNYMTVVDEKNKTFYFHKHELESSIGSSYQSFIKDLETWVTSRGCTRNGVYSGYGRCQDCLKIGSFILETAAASHTENIVKDQAKPAIQPIGKRSNSIQIPATKGKLSPRSSITGLLVRSDTSSGNESDNKKPKSLTWPLPRKLLKQSSNKTSDS